MKLIQLQALFLVIVGAVYAVVVSAASSQTRDHHLQKSTNSIRQLSQAKSGRLGWAYKGCEVKVSNEKNTPLTLVSHGSYQIDLDQSSLNNNKVIQPGTSATYKFETRCTANGFDVDNAFDLVFQDESGTKFTVHGQQGTCNFCTSSGVVGFWRYIDYSLNGVQQITSGWYDCALMGGCSTRTISIK